MPVQMSTALRDARLNVLETAIGTFPTLWIYGGTQPSNCTVADTTPVLVDGIPLGDDWMAASSNGSKAKNGTWSKSAVGTGEATHFRIKSSVANGSVVHMQGSCGVSGSGADMILDNTSVAQNQTVTVTAFVLNEDAHITKPA
jgi:hypothetical protein